MTNVLSAYPQNMCPAPVTDPISMVRLNGWIDGVTRIRHLLREALAAMGRLLTTCSLRSHDLSRITPFSWSLDDTLPNQKCFHLTYLMTTSLKLHMPKSSSHKLQQENFDKIKATSKRTQREYYDMKSRDLHVPDRKRVLVRLHDIVLLKRSSKPFLQRAIRWRAR